MGLISKIYGNPAAIQHAKTIRDLNTARQKKQAERRERKRLAKAAKQARQQRNQSTRPRAPRRSSSSLITPPYVKGMGSAFYLTREWRELRYKALKANGAKCQCCNAQAQRLHVDHIQPRSRFPDLELQLSNLQVLCADCNIGKGAWDTTDWRK